jgi:oligoribonuclease NrnB/cAMP/cGMP phosphodiesterase (DHH superfamily)
MNWIIVSWVAVAILTAVNVFIFMKVIYPSVKMMKQMGGKNGMPDINSMMKQMGGGGGRPAQGMPDMSALMNQMNNPKMQAQMKQAMDMLAQMQKNQKR